MPNEEQTLDEKLAILYRAAWLNGLDGEKRMEKWVAEAKTRLGLENE